MNFYKKSSPENPSEIVTERIIRTQAFALILSLFVFVGSIVTMQWLMAGLSFALGLSQTINLLVNYMLYRQLVKILETLKSKDSFKH